MVLAQLFSDSLLANGNKLLKQINALIDEKS